MATLLEDDGIFRFYVGTFFLALPLFWCSYKAGVNLLLDAHHLKQIAAVIVYFYQHQSQLHMLACLVLHPLFVLY